MTALERDAIEVEALLTDRYLESVLARTGTDLGPADASLNPTLRLASDRLRRDLVRVHPSFRFEERLAARLAEAAAALRMPAAVGAEGGVIPFVTPVVGGNDGFDPLAFDDPTDERREVPRPLLIGGALTSAAISLAGAAFVAWRLAHPGRATNPMVRAARAARASRALRDARLAATHIGRLD
jgi:uncharacterized protein YheU (UPF0270 family)